jgi:hypothetical protein
LKSRRIALAVVCGSALFISPAEAQLPTYLGPGLFTRGAGDIGARSGNAVDFRMFAGVSAVYDDGLQPASLDSTGHLFSVNALYGTEVNLGVYGQHQFKHAKLGLDYHGTLRHYNANTFWDGSDHQLALGYTYQHSPRITLDFREIAGSSSLGTSFVGSLPAAFNSVVDPTTLLFDNRTLYVQSTTDISYSLTQRASVTIGGDWSAVGRQSSALIGVDTYGLHGSIQRRLSRNSSVGIALQHTHYDFQRGFGQSDIDTFQGFWSPSFGRSWILSVHVGAYQSKVAGLLQVNPLVATVLGLTSPALPFSETNLLPNGDAVLTRSFRRSFVALKYERSVTAGNGVYTTSRQELGDVYYAYTGIRKWSFTMGANYGHLTALGQGLPPYRQYSGNAGLTYAVTRAIYATANYGQRHYDITDFNNPFRRTASRITLGLSFSPAEIPLSFR